MSDASDAAGLAALAICESTLLSLTDTNRLDEAEATAILADAAAAHRGAAALADGAGGGHAAAAALIEAIIRDGNAVRRVRPASTPGGDGSDPA